MNANERKSGGEKPQIAQIGLGILIHRLPSAAPGAATKHDETEKDLRENDDPAPLFHRFPSGLLIRSQSAFISGYQRFLICEICG